MDSRQRVTAALQHRQPDRTPVFEYVLLSPLADVFLGHAYAGDPLHWDAYEKALGWEEAVRQDARDRVVLADVLGHDLLYAIPHPPPERRKTPAGYPPPSTDPVANLEQRNEWHTRNADASDADFLVFACIHTELAQRELDLPILAPAYNHGVWTDTDLMQTMALDSDIAHCHFELATRRSLAAIERYLELGIDQVGIGGDFSGTRPLISPRHYREYILPELRQLSEHLHAGGAYVVNASDGDLWPVIDDFLLNSGVDAYLEIDLHAGMDLYRLKSLYGKHITFYGNLDCGIELSFGTPELVRQHTLDCLQAGWGDGGHILCASNAITASVPLENYLAALNAYRDFFGLPRFLFSLAAHKDRA
jgi:hypothetical protein